MRPAGVALLGGRSPACVADRPGAGGCGLTVPEPRAFRQDPLDQVVAGTLTGKLPTMADVVDACVFLLENKSVNGVDLTVDGGWR